jgi:hypothetical protein
MGARSRLKRERTRAREALDKQMRGLRMTFDDGTTAAYEPSLLNHASRERMRVLFIAQAKAAK